MTPQHSREERNVTKEHSVALYAIDGTFSERKHLSNVEDLPAERMLPDKVAPSLERAHQSMPEVRWEWIEQNRLRQIQSVNVAPDYRGRDSAIYLSMGQGVAQREDSCRVDRHFVAAGYYFQIIAVAFHVAAPEPCRVAEELAGWSAAQLRPGAGCPR